MVYVCVGTRLCNADLPVLPVFYILFCLVFTGEAVVILVCRMYLKFPGVVISAGTSTETSRCSSSTINDFFFNGFVDLYSTSPDMGTCLS